MQWLFEDFFKVSSKAKKLETLLRVGKRAFGQRATRKYLTSVPVLKDVTSGVDFGRKDFVYFLQILSQLIVEAVALDREQDAYRGIGIINSTSAVPGAAERDALAVEAKKGIEVRLA
ncbi:hypothetical protein L1987_88749 [Smallanthus sonchifolius]|nr:hypothetical protein L1987_88749 [Smallanthus sonchifolius]